MQVAATIAYNGATNTATLTPTSPLAYSTTYTVIVRGGSPGVKDLAGNALALDATASFTTAAAPDTTPPTVTGFSPTNGTASVATNVAATVTFSEAMTASTVNTSTVFLRNAAGATVASTIAYNASTNTATLTPTSTLANSTTYTIVVKGGAAGVKDAAGNALAADVTSSFTTVAAPTAPVSLWSNSPTPATVDSGDNQAVELGMKFTSDVNGQITGLRFYKSAANTGTHTAHLWSASGQLLATATFTGETVQRLAAGELCHAGRDHGGHDLRRFVLHDQRTLLGQPVVLQLAVQQRTAARAGQRRRVSLRHRAPCRTRSYQGSNYWVDVLLSTTPQVDVTPPTVTAFNPTAGATNVAINAAPTVTFSEAMTASTINSTTHHFDGRQRRP